MKTLTIKDLKKLVGQNIRVRSDYSTNKNNIVKLTNVEDCISEGLYNVETKPKLVTAPLTLRENGHGFISNLPIFTYCEEGNDNNTTVITTDNGSGNDNPCYCSCANPNLIENSALDKKFFVCRNCGKEKL